jgi:endonuclease-3
MNSRVLKILNKLKEEYPEVNTPLTHKNAFELLVATMMSAQTLDTTVNKVTPLLFSKYDSPEKFAEADPLEIEKIIRIVNYHKTKSRNIVKMSQKLLEEFNGKVPLTIEDLTTLPGVGRKTANVVISDWFVRKEGRETEGIVVDTHVIRTSNRLGFTKNKTAVKVEQDLMKLFPKEEWNDISLRLIFHGRFRCKARNPECYKDEFWSEVCGCVKEKKIENRK